MVTIDISVSSLVVLIANNGTLYRSDLKSFQFNKVICDLWVLSLLRFFFSFACIIAIIRYKQDAIRAIKRIKKFQWLIMIIVFAFLIAKAFSRRHHSKFTSYDWYEITICITVIFTLLWLLVVFLLSGLYFPSELDREHQSIEFVPLLDNTSEDNPDNTLEDGSKAFISNICIMYRLLRFFAKDKYYIALVFISFLVMAMIVVAVPYIEGLAFEVIFDVGFLRKKSYLLVNLGLILSAQSIVAIILDYSFRIQIAKMVQRIRVSVFQSIIDQRIQDFDKNKSSEITSRLIYDVDSMSRNIVLGSNILLSCIPRGVGISIFMYILSYKLALVTFLYLPLMSCIISHFQPSLKVSQ